MADSNDKDGGITREVTFTRAALRDINTVAQRFGDNYSDAEGFGDAIGRGIGELAVELEQIPPSSKNRLLIEYAECPDEKMNDHKYLVRNLQTGEEREVWLREIELPRTAPA